MQSKTSIRFLKLAYPMVAIILIAVIILSWGLYQAREQQNHLISTLAEQSMDSALNALLKNQRLLTKDYAFWDETLTFIDEIVDSGVVDKAWAERNIGAYLNSSFHLNFTAIFDSQHLYWLHQNATVPTSTTEAAVAEVLNRMKVFDRLQQNWQQKPPEVLSGYLYIDQRLYMVSFSLIASDELDRLPVEHNRKAFMIAKEVNESVLAELAQIQNASNLRLESLLQHESHLSYSARIGNSEASVVLKNLNGKDVAILCWEPSYRLDAFYYQLIPWLLSFLLLSGACIGVYMRKVRQEGAWLDGEIERRRKAEADLGAYQAKLEQLVAQRTDELFQALQSAERAGEEKARFTARMSHEMRTPLNAISGFTQLLQFDETDPEKQEQLAEIQLASGRLLEIVNQVLSLSDIGLKHAELQGEHCCLNEAITPLLFEYQTRGKQLGLTLTMPVLGETEIDIQLPASVVIHALKVLLDNACLYTDAQGSIELQTHQVGEYCELWVCDTGIGIPIGDAPKLFQPFSRLHFDQLPNVKGVGLNLFMLRKKLQALGADVQYAGAHQPKGSCFKLSLPLLQTV